MSPKIDKIACIGQMVVDVIIVGVRRLPENGVCDIIDSATMKTGGCATNSAAVFGRLGTPAGMFGLVGQDPQADFLLSSLGETGVDLRGVKKTHKGGTPTSIVILNVNGDRSFLYHPGAMAKLSFEDLDMDLLDECSIWHIPGFVKLTALDSARVFKEGHKRGKICTLDTDYDPTGKWYENVAPLLEHLDYFMPSYDEAAAITGLKDPDDNAKFFLDKGITTVVIKLGEEGCLIRRGNERLRLPSYKVKCVDTTGAGDSFVAGFLTGVMKGWSLEESGRLGNACGAMAVMAIGAGGVIKDFDGVMEFMKENRK